MNIKGLLIILLAFIVFPVCVWSQESTADLETQLARYQKEGNLLEIARCQTRLGFIYRDNNNNNKAISYFKDAIESNETLGNTNAVKNLSVNLGMLYAEVSNNDQAIIYFRKSLKINEALGKMPYVVADLLNIAQVQQNQKSYSESNKTAEKAASLAQEINDMVPLKNSYAIISENYEKQGRQDEAKRYFDLAAAIKAKLQKEELKKFESRTQLAEAEVSVKNIEIQSKEKTILNMTREQQLTLELVDKQKEILAKQKENAELKEKEFKAKERLHAIERRNTLWTIGLLAVILLIVAGSLVFIFKQLNEKKKAYSLLEASNKQIIEQKREIEVQRDIATHQKRKITDSITYAQRIQHAAMPPLSIIEEVLPEHFILYRPRDIVSGDFYWMAEKEGILVVAAVDCTGHGVPGAFMSMLGIAFLNDIVNKTAFNKHIRSLQANEILNQLREHVINSLHQSGKVDEPKDGMDIALCIIDLENNQLQFAGAHNSAFIIRDGEPVQLNADKMSIGIFRDTDTSFTNHQFELKRDDLIYIYTDGYYDQFGGPKGHKLLSSNLKKYLLEIHKHPMAEQKRILEDFYDKWKGKNEQIDDVMIVGLKFAPQEKISNVMSVLLWPDKHFLIAEDTEINYILLREALKQTKVKITRVFNGLEAVEACKQTKFDLVLMDISMPVMDGLEASRKIREFDNEIPIVAHTALARDGDICDYKEAGCNDYIAKPVDMKLFLSVISKNLLKNI